MTSSNTYRSLARRLGRAVVSAVLIALVVGSALTVLSEAGRYAADKRDALRAVATIFASATAKAVAAGDEVAAAAALRGIAEQRNVTYAAVVRADGSLVAEQGLGLRLADDLDLDRKEGVSAVDLALTRSVRLSVPVIDGGREIGSVTVVAETADLAERLLAVLQNAALAAVAAVAIGLLVAWRLQKALTTPLRALAETMNAVRENHDYARVAAVTTNDEVGVLATTFNGLLGAVRERDQALAEHRASLEQEILDRTVDLRDAKDMAEAANAAKSTFLATMSHEIRTPMNGMLVMAELLAGADLPARQQRYAEVIARSGQSLLAIINDILDFAKVESGKLELERIPVSTSDLVDTVVTLFGERARAKGLDIAAEVAADVPASFVGDPVRLGQVLGNFVNNALKFTETGHVLIRIAALGAGGIEIRVSDTGIGIPADKLPTIFSAFSQADQSTTRRFGGTGLGLSIAQSLVAAMGGEIGVSSEVGVGSTFWIRLPVEALSPANPAERAPSVLPLVGIAGLGSATEAALRAGLDAAGFTAAASSEKGAVHWVVAADALLRQGRRPSEGGRVLAVAPMGDASGPQVQRRGLADEVLRWPLVQAEWQAALAALAGGHPFASGEASATASDGPPRFAGLRVLVADDNAVNREVASEALHRCGVTDIRMAENGREAVDLARQGSIDLILMDGSMPVLDGFDASREIRAAEAAGNADRVPIFALTAHVIGTAADAWRDAGMDGVLVKPFTLADLAQLLASIADPAPRVFEPAAAGAEMQPVAEAETPLLNLDTLASLFEIAEQSGTDFIDRLLRLFREHGPTALDALQAAIDSADAAAVGSAAHSLKSMSANIGAAALGHELAQIERGARIEAVCPEATILPILRTLFERTSTELEGVFAQKIAA
ncbi:signal transduction histidine kinase/DNA-binding NarL/FixJ family response regulator/HPt (histidine-containing phosphotransfer) domain-containing protein [Methylobacterium sp. BE186]|uniref:ATP-binding protein n=1 Tax=Methylobacterium sp. BE186 TaxID=2817715 RepID=UPI002859DA16|nr:ATP-binding protein [Methylobacterium sp. BE186]MDR7036135.1 signal transduction histidine kinase/DNA-binding NarL/FixJ family response regulator/HPt (histidine-containing phosphotransfer) domain-containing protein [Methylobacterium sp. BE186]